MKSLIRFNTITLFLIIFSSNCFAQFDPKLEELGKWMEGSFSSQDQSKNDSDYFDIRLEMKRIWKDRTDAIWFYVEQATAETPDKPYRQRIYKVQKVQDNLYQSEVFVMNDPLRFAGAFTNDSLLGSLTPDSLINRTGCAVFLSYTDGKYSGGTESKECPSDLRGAKYATSDVIITSNSIISWDKGFDENDKQVWGAKKGGYIFKRIE
ncbi:MAG TPA: chromophore lyase CpcT/CpeT [Ignavibacteria bacterium]|nr:chromophore lyase CpcT/CpeT [Ignavibacteria bacterium]